MITFDLLFYGITFSFIGKVLLGASVILVHSKIAHDKKIDLMVLSEMRREKYIAALSILLIILGYILEIWARGYISLI